MRILNSYLLKIPMVILLCSCFSAAGYAGERYVYRLEKCGIKLTSPRPLVFKKADSNSTPLLPTSLCKMQFQIAGGQLGYPWALLAVLNGNIDTAVAENPELPWHATEKPHILEFFQAGHPPQAPTDLPDGRQIISTTYGVMNCRRIKESGSMAMCDSETGLISNGRRTLLVDLDASEANISATPLLMGAVFINRGRAMQGVPGVRVTKK